MLNTNIGGQQKDKEQMFWDTQNKDRYISYEKKVYAAFREKEYIEILNKGLSGFNYKKNSKLLDVGCGAGVSSIVLSNLGFEVVGIDISPNLINQAVELVKDPTIRWLTPSGRVEGNPSFIVGDVSKIELPNESIDICYLSGVLHHFPNYDVILKELYRVLKKDGIMIACEPNKFNLPYRLSFYLVNLKEGVTTNEFPLSPMQVEKDTKKYFRDIKLSQFKEDDVPFLRQLGWLGKSVFGSFIKSFVLFLENKFASENSKGNFFIISCKK